VRTRRPRATPVPAVEPEAAATPIDRPRIEATEKPSLGTDLQDATRAYKQAVETHNQRVDEYNALADEVQRRNAWDDSQSSVELRRRLDRAREAVENARVQAEMLRARMESVRARYR
jgi:small-conductance mechanosensitive channel